MIPIAGDLDPVRQALGRLESRGRLPAVTDLAEGLMQGLAGLVGVREAAILVMAEVAGNLDQAWNRRPLNCLARWIGPGQARWVASDAGWRKGLVEAAEQAGIDGVAAGSGPWTRRQPWPSDPWGPQDPWLATSIMVGSEPLLYIVAALAPDRPRAEAEAVTAELVRLKETLEPVLGIWAEAAALGARLTQAAAENRTLSRINQMQGRFVAMASHEFKTPLTSISAYADVLKGQITPEMFPQALDFLEVIRAEAARLLRMVNRILDFSRMEFGSSLLDLKILDLEPLVRETARSLQPGIQTKNLTLVVRAPRRLPRVEIDADLIRQVLVNLVGNAVKYTPQGGSILVTLAEEESTVSVAVSDDGPGIAPAEMRRIFREFYRAPGAEETQEGTGLGLTIARHIVHLHGGHITVGNSAQGGSEFVFLLPKAAQIWAPLPRYLTKDGSQEDFEPLLVNLMRLLAEQTGSRAAALLLRDGAGNLLPVCGLGLEEHDAAPGPFAESDDWYGLLESGATTGLGNAADLVEHLPWLQTRSCRPEQWLLAPVARQSTSLGCLILGCRRQEAGFNEADLTQVEILTDLVHTALERLDLQVGKTIEAVKSLIQIRRCGVPTATPGALALVRKLAVRLRVDRAEIRNVQCAAALHDAGMARVEDEIVLGEGSLTWDEKDAVDGHVEHGLDLMRPLIPNEAVARVIRHHHERWDGRGYPDRLAETSIPLGSRILAVVDAWFSLTTDRPYRRGLPVAEALAEIRRNARTQFDPAIVSELAEIMEETADPVGPGPVPAGGPHRNQE